MTHSCGDWQAQIIHICLLYIEFGVHQEIQIFPQCTDYVDQSIYRLFPALQGLPWVSRMCLSQNPCLLQLYCFDPWDILLSLHTSGSTSLILHMLHNVLQIQTYLGPVLLTGGSTSASDSERYHAECLAALANWSEFYFMYFFFISRLIFFSPCKDKPAK